MSYENAPWGDPLLFVRFTERNGWTELIYRQTRMMKERSGKTLSKRTEQQNLELLEQYFRDGCKWNCLQKLGVENEKAVATLVASAIQD